MRNDFNLISFKPKEAKSPVHQESHHQNIVVKGEKLRVAKGKPLQNKVSP